MIFSSLTVSLLPSMAIVPSPYARVPMTNPVELSKLRIPIEAARRQQETDTSNDDIYTRAPAVGYHSASPVLKTEASSVAQSPYGPTTHSPSSPFSFFTQPKRTAKVCHFQLTLMADHSFSKQHLKRWWLHSLKSYLVDAVMIPAA